MKLVPTAIRTHDIEQPREGVITGTITLKFVTCGKFDQFIDSKGNVKIDLNYLISNSIGDMDLDVNEDIQDLLSKLKNK